MASPLPSGASTVSCRMLTWKNGEALADQGDVLSAEEPLEIRINGRPLVMTMRTPGEDAELAAGYLWAEGLIARSADIIKTASGTDSEAEHSGDWIDLNLAPEVRIDHERFSRSTPINSSCGVCGKTSIDLMQSSFPSLPAPAKAMIDPEVLVQLPEKLYAKQKEFHRTGGLHAAGVFDCDGRLVVCREDVGRHNAVDKVIGHGFFNGLLPYSEHILAVSGRASFEILQKALSAGVPMIASVSAPSSYAVRFAQRHGQTLAGFVRAPAFNLYSYPERVRLGLSG